MHMQTESEYTVMLLMGLLRVVVIVMTLLRAGILVFAAMFGTLFHANSTLRRLIAQHVS